MGIRPSAMIACLLLSLALGASARWTRTQSQAPFEPAEGAAFVRLVREALRQHDERLNAFNYIERRRDPRVSMLGKVTVGPERTFEVYPSPVPGLTYKRLIAVEGRPLDPDELARRDAEHQRDLVDRAAREAKETPSERRARLAEYAADVAERERMIDDAFAVFEPAWVGRDTIDGASVVVADLSPRRNASVSTRQGRWMKHFAGRVWIDEATHQIVRIEMQARDDISIGWGIVGRIHEKTRFVASWKRVGDMWLPAELVIDASGKTLMFRSFDVRLVTVYSDYKRTSPTHQS